jgi:hypothetical protein
MSGYMPVEVPRGAFLFCRWSVALLLWAGAIARIEALVGFCAAVMALSAILTVGRAPLITLYALTVERIRPSRVEILDRNGMRFAHTVATLFIGVPFCVTIWGSSRAAEAAWRFLLFVALFKTAGAMGYCAVSRLYTCALGNGSCCTFLKPKTHV